MIFRGASEPHRGHLLERLDAIFSTGNAPLLEPHHRDLGMVVLSPEGMAPLLLPLLVPGITRCGEATYEGVIGGPDGPLIRFRLGAELLTFSLARKGDRTDVADSILTRVGSVVLRGDGIHGASISYRRVATHLSYVLHLALHPGMRLFGDSPDAAPGRGEPAFLETGSDRDTFLQERYADEAEVIRALLHCRGEIVIAGNAERECLRCAVAADHPGYGVGASHWATPLPGRALDRLRMTDPQEPDVIRGDRGRGFEEILLGCLEPAPPNLIVAFDSCLSKLVGNTVPAVIEHLSPVLGGVHTIYLDGSVAALHNYPQMWEQLLRHRDGAVERSAEPSINLVGFGAADAPSSRELENLLDLAGVRVNQWLVPGFDLSRLAHLDAAWVHVFSPARLVRDGPLEALARGPRPLAPMPAPVGFEGTKRWLHGIRAACGLSAQTPLRLDEELAALMPAWQSLRDKARGRGVGIVLRDVEIESPDTRHRWGMPWLELLEEMGFTLSFVALPGAGGLAGPRADLAGAFPWLDRKEEHRWIRLADAGELDELLAQAPFELVYTEVYRDKRVTRAGKIPFSVADLEPGISGAMRALERLLALASTPFYRRYRPAEGRRPCCA